MYTQSVPSEDQAELRIIPDKTKCAHANWLKVRVSARVSESTPAPNDHPAYLEVISKVVPKI
jgi:hypothetical protein